MYNVLYLIRFMKLNRKLLTAKQGKCIIKEYLKFYDKKEMIRKLLSEIKLSDIQECTSFTTLEIMLLLKDTIYNSCKEFYKFHESQDFYHEKFKQIGTNPTINFPILLTILKYDIFTINTDPLIFTTFCEMYMNNCVKDLSIQDASYCFMHFSHMYKILNEEKDDFFGFDVVIKIVEKFLFKFYCEKTIVNFLPLLTSDENLEDIIIKMKPICILYLQTLLVSEPDINTKLIYRLECLEKRINKDNNFWEKMNEQQKYK